jgi:hypothetical protein
MPSRPRRTHSASRALGSGKASLNGITLLLGAPATLEVVRPTEQAVARGDRADSVQAGVVDARLPPFFSKARHVLLSKVGAYWFSPEKREARGARFLSRRRWWVARSYNTKHLEDRRWWYPSGAALAIWLTRNWTADELIAKGIELDLRSEPAARCLGSYSDCKIVAVP